MYKLLLLVPIYLALTGCAQHTIEPSPKVHYTSHTAPYSLEELDARYRQQGY